MNNLFLNDAQIRRLIPDFMLLNNDLLIIDATGPVKDIFETNIHTRLVDIFSFDGGQPTTVNFNYLQSFATQTVSFVTLKAPVLKYALKIEYLEEAQQLLLVFENLFPERVKLPSDDTARFFYAITHELKNPLAAIQSSAELIQLKLERAAKELSTHTKGHFEAIFWEVDKVALVLKNIAFISSGATICLKKTSTILYDFVQNILQYSFLTHFEYGKFNVVVKGKQCGIMIDQQLFAQVIVNLVNMVMQYSKEENPIDITIWFLKNKVKIIVEDPQAILEEANYNKYGNILNATNPNDISDNREWGLLVVKKIMAAHKGSVELSGKKLFNAGFLIKMDS